MSYPLNKKFELVGRGKDRRLVMTETKEINIGDKNIAEYKSELRQRLSKIRSEVKRLKLEADEIIEIIKQIESQGKQSVLKK